MLEWLQDRGANMLCELIGGLAGIGLYGLSRAHLLSLTRIALQRTLTKLGYRD